MVQIYDLETRYVATANPQGNALKGARHCQCLLLPHTHGDLAEPACIRLHTLGMKLGLLDKSCKHAAGYEGFLSQSSAPARRGPVKPEERLFSSSSVTGASHLPA